MFALMKANAFGADQYLEHISIKVRSAGECDSENKAVNALLMDADKLKEKYGDDAFSLIKVKI